MSDYKRLVDKRWIAIGKSLPVSIYDSHRKLLLAQGHVIESARSLQRLVEHGQYYRAEGVRPLTGSSRKRWAPIRWTR